MRSLSADDAPCGLLLLELDGTVLAANRTTGDWTGRTVDELVGLRLAQLLSVGGRIYWETHLSPLLLVDRRVDEVALELVGPGGRWPVLLTATVGADDLVRAALTQTRERSRYERELLAARTAADLAASRLTALQGVTAALSRSLGVSAVSTALLEAAVGPLGAAAATLWLPSDDGLRPYAALGEELDPSQPPSAADADGRTAVPLPGALRAQGVLSLRPRSGGGDDPLDPELLLPVGQQAGLALDRALLQEQSATVAHELQHALLAVDAPVDTRFTVATTYRAGMEMLEVGGDWYDVFLADQGVLSVVVGDVVGRGLGAASAMGQLRSATRALSEPGRPPAAVLERLDRFVEQVPAAAFATVVHAQLDLATGVVRLACAGHPPPVLVPRAAPPHLLWGGRSTPLGVQVAAGRTDTTVQLTAGDRLLLYTDGLVERRDAGIDERLAVLEQASTELVGVDLERGVERLVAELLVDEQHRDDVCVLLLEWSGPVFERHLSADLRTLAEVRHDLRRWLADRGLDNRMADDVVLATSEALANAAEHGSGGRSTERVHLQVRVEQDPDRGSEVVVRVTDTGRWQAATGSNERGRGLTIARALVDEVVVETGDGTSVLLRHRLGAAAS